MELQSMPYLGHFKNGIGVIDGHYDRLKFANS